MSNISIQVSTRFGVGVTDENWLRHRIKLFEAITCPSLAAQQCQDFTWNIFVGRDPVQWVVDELRRITDGVGREVIIHRDAQSARILRAVASNIECNGYLTALIDDDDAWHRSMLGEAEKQGLSFQEEGVERAAFTFSLGYEWLISDLVDVDALVHKGQKIIRKQALYPYVRPFLTMSSFIYARSNVLSDFLGRVHSTHGECLTSEGYLLKTINNATPMWLYTRHRHADSSIRKAHGMASSPVSLEVLGSEYGIDVGRVMRYQQEADLYGYSNKRIHKAEDKSCITFSLPDSSDFVVAQEKEEGNLVLPRCRRIADDEWEIDTDGLGCGDRGYRLIAYDIKSRAYILKKVYDAGDRVLFGGAEVSHLDSIKLKIQTWREAEEKWVNVTPYFLIKDALE